MSVIRCISPVDDRVWHERETTSPAEIATAVEAARDAQLYWRTWTIAERATWCNAAIDALLSHGEAIVEELAWQMGRPVASGAGELRGFEERARHMIAIAEESLADVHPPEDKPGFTRFVRRVPVGTVLTIAPWNFPFMTAVNSIIPALMAGNAVFLKHAANTLRVAERFAEAFEDARLPDGIFRHLVMDHATTAELIGSGGVDMVCFTGSVEGGRAIEQAAAGRFLHVGLELGGKDPAYVREDADLAHAIENLADGAFFNSGQSCCGIERIYVHESRFEAFVEGLADTASQLVLGNPLEPATTLGPMVSARAADAVRAQLTDALGRGARAHVDTDRFPLDRPGSPYLGPQVLSGVTHDMAMMREESFGPVVGIMPVRDDDEAIALMNDSPFGLTASIWTADEETTLTLADRLHTGTVFMNRCDYLDPSLAWTGVKDTGRGVTLSPLGYHALTQAKSYHFRTVTSE